MIPVCYTIAEANRKKCHNTNLEDYCISNTCMAWTPAGQKCSKCGKSDMCKCQDRIPRWIETGYCADLYKG